MMLGTTNIKLNLHFLLSAVVYLTTPPFTLQVCNVDDKVSDELEGIWNENAVTYSRYPGIFAGWPRKATKNCSEERLWPRWYSKQASDRFPHTNPFLLQARRLTSRTFACGSIRRDPKALLSTSEPARTARGFPISSTGEIYRQVALLLSVFGRRSSQAEGLQFYLPGPTPEVYL